MALRYLLLAAPLSLACALRRAAPDPNIEDNLAVAMAHGTEIEKAAKEDPNLHAYKSLPPTEWTPYQVMEEMTTNFTGSAVFKSHLGRWCGSTLPDTPCALINRMSHYCPSLLSALNYTLNRSELVASLMDELSMPDIFSKAGLEASPASLLQVSSELHQSWAWQRKNKTSSENVSSEQRSWPWQRKNRTNSTNVSRAQHSFWRRKATTTTPAPKPVLVRHKQQDLAAKIQEARDQDEANKAAMRIFINPFPEVTESERFAEVYKKKCEYASMRKADSCINEAKDQLLCLVAGKFALKVFDMASLSKKMQAMLEERFELHFKN